MAFNIKKLSIPEVYLIEPEVFEDKRGYFAEIYKSSDFRQFGINKSFVQVNYSKSKKGVLRGLHYQLKPAAQGKLVQCLAGRIFDVAVDIRKGSPYYKKWLAEILSQDNRKMLYIPEGFAHGFCALSDDTEIIYYLTGEYSKKHERGIIYNDEELNIDWPVKAPFISEKDAALPLLKNAENNFVYHEK